MRIDAVNGVYWGRRFAHIRSKIGKRLPSIAHGYSDAAVEMPHLVSGVSTSTTHHYPSVIEWMFDPILTHAY